MNEMGNSQGYAAGGPLASVPYQGSMPGIMGSGDSLFTILRRSWLLILLALILAGGGAYGYLRLAKLAGAGRLAGKIPESYLDFIKPQYQSTARVIVERDDGPEDSVTPKALGSTGNNFLQTQAILLASPEVLHGAIADPNVLSQVNLQDEARLLKLLGTLDVKVGKNSDVLSVTARSSQPNEAAVIVNAVVRSYIRWHQVETQSTAKDLHDELSKQLEDARGELEKKWERKALLEERQPALLEGSLQSQTLDLLKRELVTSRAVLRERETYCQSLQTLQSDPNKFRQYVEGSRQTTASPVEAQRGLVQKELLAIDWELEQIAAGVISAQRKKVGLLEERKLELEEELAKLNDEFIQNEVALAAARYEDARSQERQLEELYSTQSEEIQRVLRQNSEYAAIVPECDLLQDLCKTLIKQMNDLDLNSRRQLTIHPLQWAAPASKPVSPQAARVLGIALAMGATAGVGLAFVRNWRDQRVRSAEDVAAILGAPMLGVIPRASKPKRVNKAGMALIDPNSRESEAYRMIRTTLLFNQSFGDGKVLLVTSPKPHEGKTTLVSNLGLAMAQAGQKTLIIDADFCKSIQRQVFATNRTSRGLSDLLAGEANIGQVVQATDIDGLDVLPSGQNAIRSAGQLNGAALALVLGELRERYDRILVDSAPVGMVSDALVLASLCDLTLLVLRANRSSRIDVQQARDDLMAVNASLCGAVINDVARRDNRYRSYRAAYHYGYGNGNGKRTGTALARRKPPTQDVADSSAESPPEDVGRPPKAGECPR